LREISHDEARKIGSRAQERVMAEHSSRRRAIQFEEIVGQKMPLGELA
jgi:spore maturation protein CgeB